MTAIIYLYLLAAALVAGDAWAHLSERRRNE